MLQRGMAVCPGQGKPITEKCNETASLYLTHSPSAAWHRLPALKHCRAVFTASQAFYVIMFFINTDFSGLSYLLEKSNLTFILSAFVV